jgi:hypothetical protein
VANKRIYTKQINMDGTASLNMYELKPIPQNAPAEEEYVTRTEFEQALLRLQDNLKPSREPQAQVAATPPEPVNLVSQF